MDFNKFFGANVARARMEKGYTQQQLGDCVGLTKSAINDIEKGRRNTLVLKALRIAAALDTTVEDLSAGFVE